MPLQQIESKQLLLSSSNENIVFQEQHQLTIEHCVYSFSFKELIPFEQMKDTVFHTHINTIQSDLKLQQNNFGFKNIDNLVVYARVFDRHYLTIFSIGEYQASLYKIYLEAVYRITH